MLTARYVSSGVTRTVCQIFTNLNQKLHTQKPHECEARQQGAKRQSHDSSSRVSTSRAAPSPYKQQQCYCRIYLCNLSLQLLLQPYEPNSYNATYCNVQQRLLQIELVYIRTYNCRFLAHSAGSQLPSVSRSLKQHSWGLLLGKDPF